MDFRRYIEVMQNMEEAFIAEIKAAPTDPAPKLIYADWLEERGDKLAVFIRDVEELKGFDVSPSLYHRSTTGATRIKKRMTLSEVQHLVEEGGSMGSFAGNIFIVTFKELNVGFVSKHLPNFDTGSLPPDRSLGDFYMIFGVYHPAGKEAYYTQREKDFLNKVLK